MEKIEIVLKKLSKLYNFNQKLQTYKIHTAPRKKGRQFNTPDQKERRFLK